MRGYAPTLHLLLKGLQMSKKDKLMVKIKINDIIEDNSIILEFIRSYLVIKSESYIPELSTNDCIAINQFMDNIQKKYREIEKLLGGL